jgi:hypothetical protein
MCSGLSFAAVEAGQALGSHAVQLLRFKVLTATSMKMAVF